MGGQIEGSELAESMVVGAGVGGGLGLVLWVLAAEVAGDVEVGVGLLVGCGKRIEAVVAAGGIEGLNGAAVVGDELVFGDFGGLG